MERVTDSPLRVGIAGAGLIAQVVHLPALRALADRFDVVAIADPSRRAGEALAGRFGARWVSDHRALLDLPGLDAVVVCSPNGTHAEVTLDALDAGLHALVEKPLCITLADADRIVARAQRNRRVVQVGTMKRFEPAYEALLDAVADERATLRHLATTTIDPGLVAAMAPAGLVASTDVPPAVRDTVRRTTAAQVAEAVGAGDPATVAAFSDAFLGALVHDVNLVHGLLDRLGITGELQVLDAAAASGGTGATGIVELPGGARWTLAWLLEPSAGEFTQELLACTSHGVHRLAFPAPYVRPSAATHTHTSAAGGGRFTSAGTRGYADAYVRQLEHLHACVTEGARCRTPAAQARRDIALLTELFRWTRVSGDEVAA